MATEVLLPIVSGFSREDLRDTLRKDQQGRRFHVTITVKIPEDKFKQLVNVLPVGFRYEESYGMIDLQLILNTISWEDGSGHSWNLDGFIPKPSNIKFKAYYHTGTRKGTLTVFA